MKMSAILFFPLLFSLFSFGQQTIKGKVVAAANGAPVAGCSVFINNTTTGTASDKNGYFELNGISPGNHELVVSSIGYETSVYSFSSAQLPLQLKVELQVKIKELDNVVVEPSVEEGWDKWGKTFTDNFIGTTPNAAHCKIKNQKAIHFRYYKKSNRVIAYSDEPLIFENKALGYRISYQLEEFEVNFKTRVSTYYGYPFFEDMETDRKSKASRWQRNRNKTYYGSMMHFIRSLFIDSLPQQGFEVRRMFRKPNDEKERVKKIYRRENVVSSQANGITVNTKNKEDLPVDSIEYYERILRQPDYKEIYAKDLLTADSLIIGTEGPNKILYFTDYIYITYKNEIEDRDYLVAQRENRQPTWQRSYLTMPDPRPVEIDINGNYPPQDILAWGYWSWSEKMADFLPLNYEP
ncbi:MAG TPA: carboxypeptidase-like regulatory domain-containing protein [Chitinophagaceae bacterium]|nr:carboxypeptidase-like regulatory domain-containing protein [Chitinophagaceae bacterium]